MTTLRSARQLRRRPAIACRQPSFQKTMYARRRWVNAILEQCSEPEQAFANWMARDEAYAR